jgi:hypothetical protein
VESGQPHVPPSQCESCIETIQHAYVSCSSKSYAWHDFLRTFTTRRAWTEDDIFSLLSFSPIDLDLLPQSNLSKTQLVACGLLGIKACNDRFYRDDTLLPVAALVNIMTSAADLIARQRDLKKLQHK